MERDREKEIWGGKGKKEGWRVLLAHPLRIMQIMADPVAAPGMIPSVADMLW